MRPTFPRPHLALGSLLLVAGCGGSFKELLEELDRSSEPRPRHELPPPAPVAPISPSPTAPATAKSPPPPAPTPPPPEPIPERLGTPASSQAKKPSWLWTGPGYAPQPTDRGRLFVESAGALRGEQVGLICKLTIRTTNHGDFDGKADLSVSVTIRQGKETVKLDARGPEDTTEMWFSVPLMTLEKGAKMRVFSIDRDLVFDDGIEGLEATFNGTYPLTAKARISELECRPLGRDIVEKQLQTPRDAADEFLAKLETVKPDLSEQYFGMTMSGDGGADRARLAIEDMAGLVGWDDPRVIRRLERLSVQQKRISDEFRAAVEAERAKLPSPADGPTSVADGGLEVRVTSYACGADVAKKYSRHAGFKTDGEFKERPCVMGLDVVNRTGAPIEVSEFHGSIGPLKDLHLLSPTGARFSVHLFGMVRDGKIHPVDFAHRPIVPNGETLSLLAQPVGKADLPGFAPPLLMRGLHGMRRTGTPRQWTSLVGGALELRVIDLYCGERAAADYRSGSPSFGFRSSDEPPPCVLRAAIRRRGGVPVKIGHFFREIKPLEGLRLLDPAGFITPKPQKDRGGYVPPLEDGLHGPAFRPFATIERNVLRALDTDIELAPGQTVELALGMVGDPLPGGMDIDKLVLDTWFDDVPSFVRVESP